MILDGLQRTHTLIAAEIDALEQKKVRDFYNYKLRLEVYVNINRFGVLYRMLTLNTGQTPMSVRHQIEMLYSDMLDKEVNGVKLITEVEGSAYADKNEFVFKNTIDGFNSYMNRSALPMDRQEMLENIKMLEKMSKENISGDIFKVFLEGYIKVFVILCEKSKNCFVDQDRLDEYEIKSSPFAKKVSKAFSTSQALTGFGAAMGIMKDKGIIEDFDSLDNEHYLKYAYIVLYKLLQMVEFGDREYSDFSILDYYSDDIQILVYDKGNVSKIEHFDISNYSVDLFSKGYSFCGEGNVFTKLGLVDQNIRVKQLPEPIRDISYINVLFMELMPLQESSYSKFHLIYQIIEILIGVVFNYKFKSFIQEIENSPDDLFEKREKLSKITMEKESVIWLFSNFCGVELQKREILNSLCEKMLQDNGKSYKENDVGNNLYAVRCLIVHNLYSLDENSRELLKELNNSFLDVVLDILFTFHEN